MSRVLSLQATLFLLAAVCVLPALGIIYLEGLAARDVALVQARSEAARLVENVAALQDRTTTATRQMLFTLSILPEVRSLDRAACADLFRQILETNPIYTNILVTDPNGEVIAAALPHHAVNLSDRKHFRDAARAKRFVPGEYIVSRTTGVPSFPLAYPVLNDEGDLLGMLMVAIELERLGEFFVSERLPEGSFLGIADGRGRRLYRTGMDVREMGRPISREVWNATLKDSGDQGVFLGRGSDGVLRLTAFSKLRLESGDAPYMTFFVAIPESMITAGVRGTVERGIVLMLAAGGMAMGLAWIMAKTLIRPKIMKLVRTAERFSAGDFSKPTGLAHGGGELEMVARALDRLGRERQQTESMLRQAGQLAEEASRTKSEFLANMSHEIRTPLNGIMGMLQILQMSDPSSEQSECIAAALRSSRRLASLLGDILDLTRIEAGKLVVRREPFFLHELRQSLVDGFACAAREKNLTLSIEFAQDVPSRLVGDEMRVRQVLYNLVGNAIKFTDKGHVTVRAGVAPDSGSDRIDVLFTVMDTGIGIPPDRIAGIFDPFAQVEGSYARMYQGAGLGLSIVRRLVRLMDGDIRVQSEPGSGTVMTVRVPFVPAGGAAVETSGEDPTGLDTPQSGPGTRVLLVEDDETNAEAMAGLIRKLGYDVVLARDGQDAVRLAGEHRFNVIFMDVQMPVMDGVTATRRLREQEGSGRRTPIVAMTAYAMAGDREHFLASGMDGYLAKPVDLEQIREMLERFAGR